MILDHIEPFVLSDEYQKKHPREIAVLSDLREGLALLYRNTERIEAEMRSRTQPSQNKLIYGNHPQFDGIPQSLIVCFFHWYSVSVCNYVAMVGYVAADAGQSREPAKTYQARIVPGPYAFRNKVAAHFAGGTRNKEDNPAERAASLQHQIAFYDGAFYAGLFVLGLTIGGKSSDSKTMRCWSLTKVHEELQRRYWINQNG